MEGKMEAVQTRMLGASPTIIGAILGSSEEPKGGRIRDISVRGCFSQLAELCTNVPGPEFTLGLILTIMLARLKSGRVPQLAHYASKESCVQSLAACTCYTAPVRRAPRSNQSAIPRRYRACGLVAASAT